MIDVNCCAEVPDENRHRGRVLSPALINVRREVRV
jgi:hypothetical protein